MKKEIISHFKENPKTKIGWWAMGFGLALFFMPPVLGTFAGAVRPLIDKIAGENIGGLIGIKMIFLLIFLIVAALTTSIKAWNKGERSWAVWLGIVPAILGSAFWIFMIVGEFVFPH